jgi:HK97 family phage major capsid protein
VADIDSLMKDINDRLASLDTDVRGAISEDRIKGMITEAIASEEFTRKMRFNGGSDARLIGSKFSRHNLGVSDVEFLYDLMTARARSGKAGPSEELTGAFNAISDAMYISEAEVRRLDQGKLLDDLAPRVPKAQARALEQALTRAMDTAESGAGQQLVGAQYVADLWAAARPASRVFGLIDTFEMTAPTTYLPVEVDIPEMLYVGESTSSTASNYDTVATGSQRVAVTANKFVIHQMWSGELEEDSIIPFIPFLRQQAAVSIAHYSDSLVMNGDTTSSATGNINLDDASPAATKHYLAADGLRHAALVDNTANATNLAGVITLAALRDLRGLMIDSSRFVDWGHPTDPNDLVYVADPATADRIATLDEVIKAKQYGGGLNAALLNGEVGRVINHAIISSMAVGKTEADGKISTTAGNNTKGQVICFNRRGIKAGWRRRVRVEVERIPATDQTRIVYSLRMGLGRFTPTGAASGIESAAVAYNITL